MSSPPPPRLAATLLLVRDDPFEVLMVLRNARGSFASALVFPGGVVDASDYDDEWMPRLAGAARLEPGERARRIAAVRETWEETGILVAATEGAAYVQPRGDHDFRALVEQHGIILDLDRLVPFGHWITPEAEPRRFDTHFYLARSPVDARSAADGTEILATRWVEPAMAIVLAQTVRLLFPTLMNLGRLAESDDVTSALDRARSRPVITVAPIIRTSGGTVTITIPESAGYGVTEFRVD
jgi:8-oxo-dGTP pyrophosphatase MutT (NUDIX family)